ncbi:MAG: Ycf51 family protein [Prochlorotrichaceae cyanobacterium]|jgi:hypothetical protein
MFVSSEFLNLTVWLGLATLAFAGLTLLSFLAQWRFRFQLVGVTGFFAVLVVGSFGLSLGLFQRVEIPGAGPYQLVYDTGSNQAVIVVNEAIDETTLEATLQQAAYNLFSPGRFSQQPEHPDLLIRARIIAHPEPGISEPTYVGEIHRSLTERDDPDMAVTIFSDRLEWVQALAQTSDKV